MKRTSIAIFGASITQQRTGYAPCLRDCFTEPVHIFGYGGMHLRDAGVCFIDQVLATDPAYCFVDWLSTGYLEAGQQTRDCIDSIIYRFSRAACRLVFLFFPRADSPIRAPFEQFCKKHLEERGVFYIDVGAEIGDQSGVLRDAVHTTDYGSKRYADVIYSKFMAAKPSMPIANIAAVPRYANIRKLKVNRSFNTTIKLEGSAEIVGFLLTIGPHSGLIEVVDGNSIETVNTWDEWCHYSRPHFNLHYAINGRIELRILQDTFDTSASRQPCDYDRVSKELVVHDVFYTGSQLKLLNRSAGRRLRQRGGARKVASGLTRRAKRAITAAYGRARQA